MGGSGKGWMDHPDKCTSEFEAKNEESKADQEPRKEIQPDAQPAPAPTKKNSGKGKNK